MSFARLHRLDGILDIKEQRYVEGDYTFSEKREWSAHSPCFFHRLQRCL